MAKLTQKEFAHLVQIAPEGATEDDVIETARRLESTEPTERKSLLSRAWEWMNKPFVDLPDIELRPDSHPAAKLAGMAGSFVEGMTSPASLGAMALSGGASVAGRAGMMGISKGARMAEAGLSLPYVAEGLNTFREGMQEENPGLAVAGAVEAGLGTFGARSATRHSFPPKKVAEAYKREAGITQPAPQFAQTWDQDFAKRVADAYDSMPHDPNNPAVRDAYNALAQQVSDQFAFLRDRAGVRMEPWTQPGQPYANSAEMMADVTKNNRLYYFPSDQGFGQGAEVAHPMLQAGRSGQPVNDEFRAVHDYFGHTQNEFQFGPLGEENAYREHAAMFTDDAIPALTTETRGQNSWVNAGSHLRRADGSLPKKGDADFVPVTERPYAEQKAGLLPKQFVGHPALDRILNSGEPYGILSAGNPAGQVLDDATNAARHQQLLKKIRTLGYEPIEQRGVYGGNPEPSVIVPGMTAEHAQQLGREFGQDAVISREGWHRLGDNATFPRTGQQFDQGKPDFYSEASLPGAGKVKYSLDFPPEAYDAPHTSASPLERVDDGQTAVPSTDGPRQSPVAASAAARVIPQEEIGSAAAGRQSVPQPAAVAQLSGNTKGLAESASAPVAQLSPSVNGSTALAVGAPAAAMAVPDDPESNWDEALRIGLTGAGAAGLGMAARRFPPELKEELDGVRQSLISTFKAQGVAKPMETKASAIRTDVLRYIREKFGSKADDIMHGWETIALPVHQGIDFDEKRPIGKLLKKGKKRNTVELNEWSKQRVRAAYETGNSADMWGNPRWLYHATDGDPEAAVQFTRLIGAFSPGQSTDDNVLNAVEAFVRSMRGEEPDAIMSSLMLGHPRPAAVRDNFKRAIQGGRIFMDKTESLAGAEIGVRDKIPIDLWLLRALGANTDRTPGKGGYRLISQAMVQAAEEAGENPFSFMAKVWMGMQKIAGTPTPSFSEGFASLALPGPITRRGVQQEVLDNFPTYRERASQATAALQKDGLPPAGYMPLARSASLPFEDWLEATQSLYRAGYETGDVLGKKKLPKSERPTSLDDLRKREQKRRAK
jgi:hypothetical protein